MITNLESELAKELARTKIDGYEIEGKLGEGGEAIVVAARYKPTNQVRALKLIRGDEQSRKRLVERELPFLVAVQAHDGFVKPYDVGETKGKAWLSLELVDGHSLRQILDGWKILFNNSNLSGVQEQLPPDFCSAVAYQVADALSYAHSNGLFYYDIKPDNLLISRLGQTKITDCGMSIHVGSDKDRKLLTDEAYLSKTPPYSAPERNDRRDFTERTNVYSLAIVLYEMLSGKWPFGGRGELTSPESIATDMEKKRYTPLTRLPGMPRSKAMKAFEAITDKCFEPNPERRYASMTELRDVLIQTREHLGYRSYPQLAIREFIERYEKLTNVGNGKVEEEKQLVL